MKRSKFLMLILFVCLSASGCETGKGALKDTQNVLSSIAGIINSGKTIADAAK